MERDSAKNLWEAVVPLLSSEPGICIMDSDYTLRMPHKAAMRLNFGEIPRESLEYINCLVENGWVVCVVTNQPRSGHQIARFLGKVDHHPYFPDSLTDQLGKDHVFGGDLWFCIPGHHYKRGPKAIKDVTEFIGKSKKGPDSKVIMIGDKETDERFAEKIGADMFVKLPDSLVSRKISSLPSPLKDIFTNLLP